MNTTSIIKCKKVSTAILQNISFEIPSKQITTVIGPSGSGKSSLLMLLNRLEEPTHGTIQYQEKYITEYPITQVRREIGIVFQSAYLFDGTVENNISYGPSLLKKGNTADIEHLLEIVDLPNAYRSREVTSLSGGEQQRVALARTLANEPKVLLLDEATSALDIQTTDLIEELLQRLINEHNLTIMMVTHNLHQAVRMGKQTLFLQSGKLLEKGVTKELFKNPATNELQQFLKE